MSRPAVALAALFVLLGFAIVSQNTTEASTGPVEADAASQGSADQAAAQVPRVNPPASSAVLNRVPAIHWHTDYDKAVAEAKAQQKMLLIVFYASGRNACRDCFLCHSIPQTLRENPSRAERYVWLMLPLNAVVEIEGKPARLLNHASFAHMNHQQGVAIIDYENPEMPYYGYVVSQFPFQRGRYYSSFALGTILDLPPGTLTQRTMIFAVRTHPDRPRSTEGEFSPVLAEEAERHAAYQAQIGVQGHHAWETRFHRINARLGQGMRSTEVVAESWPGETLVEAAIECVHSWRQSSGHWSAVARPHRAWGYDMRRGRNGIWYGTGIFGR